MPVRRRPPALLDLLDSIYAASLNPSLWLDAVEEIRIAAHGSHGCLTTLETPRERGGFAFSQQCGTADFAEFLRLAPTSAWIARWKRMGRPQDCVLTADMMGPMSVLEATPIYQEFFKPRDMHDSATAVLFNGLDPGHPATTLTVAHKAGWGKEKAATTLLKKLLPHVKRALGINRTLAERETVRRASLDVLHQLSVPALIVSRDHSATYLNPAAERLMHASDGLSLRRRKLTAARIADSRKLERIIEQAVSGAGPACGASLRLARPSGRPTLDLTITPVKQGTPACGGLSAPATMITVLDPDWQGAVRADVLQQRLNLTCAESRVLAALIEGRTPTETAERLHLSVKTVRMHLSRLFLKTGTRRQADLLRTGLLSLGVLRPMA